MSIPCNKCHVAKPASAYMYTDCPKCHACTAITATRASRRRFAESDVPGYAGGLVARIQLMRGSPDCLAWAHSCEPQCPEADMLKRVLLAGCCCPSCLKL